MSADRLASTPTIDLTRAERPYKRAARLPARERFGRYEVQEQIGQGATGRVYRAVDPLAFRQVAVKSLRTDAPGADSVAECRRRFAREAQAAGGLAHPNVVRIYDQGADFMVMELLEGETLGTLLRRRGALPLGTALRILNALAGALDHAHARGVVHRDVKPGNVMICSDGEPTLMDFGLAVCAGEDICASDRFLGTPSYMSPEQVARGHSDARSDIFSLAVLAYETLTGQRPFRGEDIGQVTWRIVHEPAPPASAASSVPAGFDAVFERALAKDPGARFGSARAFTQALDAARDTALTPAPAARTTAARQEETTDVAGLVAARARGRGVSWTRTAAEPVLHVAIDDCALEVLSDPVGGLVLVDGVRMGHTPLVLARLVPGPHILRVIQSGYAPVQMGFTTDAGAPPSSLHFTLFPAGSRAADDRAPLISRFQGILDALSGQTLES